MTWVNSIARLHNYSPDTFKTELGPVQNSLIGVQATFDTLYEDRLDSWDGFWNKVTAQSEDYKRKQEFEFFNKKKIVSNRLHTPSLTEKTCTKEEREKTFERERVHRMFAEAMSAKDIGELRRYLTSIKKSDETGYKKVVLSLSYLVENNRNIPSNVRILINNCLRGFAKKNRVSMQYIPEPSFLREEIVALTTIAVISVVTIYFASSFFTQIPTSNFEKSRDLPSESAISTKASTESRAHAKSATLSSSFQKQNLPLKTNHSSGSSSNLEISEQTTIDTSANLAVTEPEANGQVILPIQSDFLTQNITEGNLSKSNEFAKCTIREGFNRNPSQITMVALKNLSGSETPQTNLIHPIYQTRNISQLPKCSLDTQLQKKDSSSTEVGGIEIASSVVSAIMYFPLWIWDAVGIANKQTLAAQGSIPLGQDSYISWT